jgi:ElaB/YqjD/DUF883 family membrane-anchored ribosome-binding protein
MNNASTETTDTGGQMPRRAAAVTKLDPKDKLIEDFRVVVSDAEELLKLTANQAGDKLNVVRGRVEESLQNAKMQLTEVENLMLERTREAVQATDDYIKANPWRSVGIAAGVGMVLGMLIARR